MISKWIIHPISNHSCKFNTNWFSIRACGRIRSKTELIAASAVCPFPIRYFSQSNSSYWLHRRLHGNQLGHFAALDCCENRIQSCIIVSSAYAESEQGNDSLLSSYPNSAKFAINLMRILDIWPSGAALVRRSYSVSSIKLSSSDRRKI